MMEDFPGNTVGGNLPASAGDIGLIPGPRRFQFSRSAVSNSMTPWTAAHQASLSITNSQS